MARLEGPLYKNNMAANRVQAILMRLNEHVMRVGKHGAYMQARA